ncbi:ParB/RepB/Spo0J family partition protein [bacterium AH-315-M10]|nr:ParB/RepB/Spo0J family partition protein [bacterium AH-315-M10]
MSNRAAILREIPIEEIQADGAFKYRWRSDQQATLRRLAEDIAANGLLVPLLVRVRAKGQYQLVAGYRRYAALLHLRSEDARSFEHVPAHVYPQSTSTKTLLAARFAENVERKNLSPIDFSYAAERLVTKDGLTHQEIADLLRLGSKKKVQRLLRLQSAPAGVRAAVHAGWLSFTAALALMEAGDCGATEALFRQVFMDHVRKPEDTWSVSRIRATIRNGSSEQRDSASRVGDIKSLGLGVRRVPSKGYSISLHIEDLEQLSEQFLRYARQLDQLRVPNAAGAETEAADR